MMSLTMAGENNEKALVGMRRYCFRLSWRDRALVV